MEPRFEVVTTPTREHYEPLCDYITKKQKGTLLYRVLMILLGVLSLMAASINDTEWVCITLLLCGLFAFFQAVTVKMRVNASWDARNTLLDIAPVTFRFDEQYIYDNHPLTASTTDYRLLTEVVETEECFLLYINKLSAYILPKSAFTVGTPEEFRLLMQQKTGRPVVLYDVKRERTRRKWWAILVPVLAVVLSAALLFVGNVEHTVTTASTDGSETLSMQLPLYLTSDDYEDGYNYLYSNDVTVSVWHYDAEYLSECLSTYNVTVEAYAQYILDSGYVEGDPVWQQDASGTWYLLNYYEGSYYRTCIFWRDDACFFVEFGCDEEDQYRYADDFAKWQASAVIEEVR